MGVARNLALDHLVHEDVCFWPDLDATDQREAFVSLGAGVDHFVGERVVAFVDQGLRAGMARPAATPDGYRERDVGAMLTDRRLVLRSPARPIPLELITGAQLTGARRPTVVVLGEGFTEVVDLDAAEALFRFVMALCQVAPESRVRPPELLVQRGDRDPTGAVEARRTLLSAEYDRRPARILAVIEQGCRTAADLLVETAADLTARAVLLDRTLARGRGMRDGFWVSLLPREDLAHLLVGILGPPVARASDGQGGLLLGCRPEGRTPGPSGSWGMVQVQVVPLGTFGGFAVRAASAPTGSSSADRSATRLVLAELPRVEAYLLLLRALYGWHEEAPALLQIPRADVAEDLRALDGAADLGSFVGPEPAARPPRDGVPL